MDPLTGDADPLARLGKAEIRDLVGKGWLTHDGMWFAAAAAMLGPEEANRLNFAAIEAMTPFEVDRLADALGGRPGPGADAGDVRDFLVRGLQTLLPASVTGPIEVAAPDAATIRLTWPPGECFAYRGMQRIGMAGSYDCGVVYRLERWLHLLGIHFETDPPTGKCRGSDTAPCVTEFRFGAG
ncbi:MAG: hypothetical protein KQH83_12110 [Actinobacteria bacterium]|nr:hypothetical protein [Actinomycetota bacterium]